MEYNKLVSGEKYSPEKFLHPSKEFGIMPFWFWNGEMSYEEIEYQLKEYKDKGCPGLYIHARFGVREELGYMNDAWMDRVDFTIQKAQEIGLQIWVYDEYNWPSGTCGQTLMEDHPELTNVYLECIESDNPGQFFTFMEGTDSRYNDLEQSEPVYACAIKTEDLEKGEYNIVDLMPSLSFDKVITWETPKGPWKMFYFIERKSTWYADVLNPETTKKFIEYTHERYKAKQGENFSHDIKGFFTDEPAMDYFEVGRDNYVIPWTKKMFKIFRDHKGYDLKKNLPKLFFDCGGDTEQVRYDFWSTLTNQYENSYFKQIHDWCKENDTLFTGHLLYEESLRMHARVDGNLFHHLRHFDVTGVDHLYPRVGTREMENESVALKIASSAAHQNGSVRLVCESMGGSYWDCTMERMKWIADWEYVLGVNQFIPHGFHYSIEGERKRDWPPSMFYQFTWWEQYGLFNDYLTRMGYMLSGGTHLSKIAILYPMNSIWANYVPEKKDSISAVIEDDFTYMTDRLLRLHMEYDYVDEDIMCDNGKIEGDKIVIGNETYEMLLLPPCTHIKLKTLEFMESFVQAGGKIVGDTLLPYKSIEGEDSDFQKRIENLFGKNPEVIRDDFLKEVEVSGELAVTEKDGNVYFVEGKGLKNNDRNGGNALNVLNRVVRACITPEIEIDNEDVFCLHRVKDGKNIFFLNNTEDHEVNIEVRIRGIYAPEIMDLEKGTIEPVMVYVHESGYTVFQLHLEPIGSAMLSYSEKIPELVVNKSDIILTKVDGKSETLEGYARLEKDGTILLEKNGKSKKIAVEKKEMLPPILLNGEFLFEINKPNSINTDCWKMKYVSEEDDAEVISSGKKDMGEWLDMRMGAWEMQLPVERDEDVYPTDLWYVTQIKANYIPDDLQLMIDGFKGSKYVLYVNGQKVTEKPTRSYLDAEIGVVPMAKYFKKGINTIAVRLTVTKKSDGMTDILKIIGKFSVEDETIVPKKEIIKMGDWGKQGYPYYSGTGTYTCHVNLSQEYLERQLILTAVIGKDVLEIEINGKPVKTCLWKPYRADITQYVHEGDNKIVMKVTNTLLNLLESSRTPSGLFEAQIIPFEVYKAQI